MPSAIGDVLARPDGRRIKLVGVQRGEFVAEQLDTFGPAFRLTAAELMAYDGVDDPTPPAESSEVAILLAADARASAEANRAFGESHPESRRARRREQELAKLGQAGEWRPPEGSPEAAFQAAAEATDDDA